MEPEEILGLLVSATLQYRCSEKSRPKSDFFVVVSIIIR